MAHTRSRLHSRVFRHLQASVRFELAILAPVVMAFLSVFSVSAFAQFVGYVPNTASDSVTIFATQLITSAPPLSNSNSDNIIQVLDKSTGWISPVRLAVLGDISLPGGGVTPHSTAYVTSQGDNGLWAIDTLKLLSSRSATATNINSGSNPLKLAQPGGVAVSTALLSGTAVLAAYVANQKDGTVSIIDIDPSSSSQNTLIANIATTGAASSSIPEVAASGNFVFVTENASVPSMWYIDITASSPVASQFKLSSNTGPLAGLTAFQLTDPENATHTFVTTSDTLNGTAIVVDMLDLSPVPVLLAEGASPVSVTSGLDQQAGSLSVQAIYVADTASGFPIWYFDVDCSSIPCAIPGTLLSPPVQTVTNAAAAPTSIGITADGQQLFFTEASSPGFQNFCVPGSSCSSSDNASDTTVQSGPTGVLVTDISTGSAPLCWLTAGGVPSPTAVAAPSTVCNNTINSNNCNANNTALGACAQSRNIAASNVNLNFQDNFGCLLFGITNGQGSPTCTAAGGLGGQTLYDIAGVFTTILSQSNSNGTGQISAQTQVSPDVTITTQPASQSINPGGQANLTVLANSAYSAVLAYQWYIGTSPNGTPITGATNSTYQPSPATTTSYWVQVNDGTGPVDSNTAVVTVNSAPSITVQPQSQSILVGTFATMSVTASGTAPLSYQWYQGASGDTTAPIQGATGSSYATPVQNTVGSFPYWVRVSNSLGHADSSTATIMVTATVTAPSITTQPASQTIASGQTATLTVEASGTSLTYQWYVGMSGNTSQLIPGATSFSYTTPVLTATTNYWVRVSNSAGQVDSNTATITVSAPLVATAPGSTTITAGQSLTYTITLNTGSSLDTLSCQPSPPSTSLPTGVNCLFSPTQISAGQSSQLTIATTGAFANLRRGRSPALFYALICPVPVWGLLILVCPHCKRRLLRRVSPILLLLVSIGCGTNPNRVNSPANSVTPPGVYTVIVTASNQNVVVAQVPVTFTVH